jgi:hypothetical protein
MYVVAPHSGQTAVLLPCLCAVEAALAGLATYWGVVRAPVASATHVDACTCLLL